MPVSPGEVLWFGPDGGPFTVVSSSNPLPVTANGGTGTFTVAGTVLSGNVPSGGPVFVGGFDGTNVQSLKTNTSGNIIPGPNSATGLLKTTLKGQALTVGNVKTSAGTLYSLLLTNNSASVQYAQIYDTVSASVTVGTTTVVLQVAIPATSSVFLNFPQGVPFANAITASATTLMDGNVGAGASTVDLYAVYQ